LERYKLRLELEKIPEPKMFSGPGSEKDPIAAYRLYPKKRPTEINNSDAPIYLTVNNCTNKNLQNLGSES